MTDRILIVGAGPTGLGAAWRLDQLGHNNWLLLEKAAVAGGLSGSVTDSRGYTWDYGGHVLFSHYRYFDALMDDLLGAEGWLQHDRESWVWIRDRFVPYAFQQNIRHLPHEEMKECVAGLVQLYKEGPGRKPANFGEWIDATFGAGIARIFMRPYNWKVWACRPEEMSYTWIGERVAVSDLGHILENIFDERDELSWGPNNRFRFPKTGGTGAIWRECARRLPQERLRFNCEAVTFDTNRHEVKLADGSVERYDYLISTMPLDRFLVRSDLDQYSRHAERLAYSSAHIVGVGLKGKPRDELAPKCWMYFPEDASPFYRVTVFSNYSPQNVPDIRQGWSLMAEVSESSQKPVNEKAVLNDVIEGMVNTQLIESGGQVVNTWHTRIEHSYPTPTLGRDAVLYEVLPALARLQVGSRGRFGAWRYEVSNQDHSFMQGVEWVNHVLFGTEELTLWHPEIVNNMRRPELLE